LWLLLLLELLLLLLGLKLLLLLGLKLLLLLLLGRRLLKLLRWRVGSRKQVFFTIAVVVVSTAGTKGIVRKSIGVVGRVHHGYGCQRM
jgi:hypothetical protein